MQYLGAGESKVETFTVTALDGTTKSISFTINGANDAAVIGTPTVASVTEDTAVVGGNLTAAGTISISDLDQNQGSFQTTVSGTGNLGSLVLGANGGYTYTVANSAVQYLGAGESKVETFTVTALDGTTKSISFTINGANDAPVLSGVQTTLQSGTMNVPYVVSGGALLAGFTDPDTSNTTLTITGLTADHGTVVANADGTYTVTPTSNYSGSIVLSYSVSDGAGGLTPATESFNLVAPVNNAPTLAAISAGSIADTAAQGLASMTKTNLSGTLVGNDADGNVLTYSISSPTSTAANYVSNGVTYDISKAGLFGTLYVESATGKYVYTPTASSIDALNTGDSRSETFTMTVSDSIASPVSQTFDISITGANEIITGTSVSETLTGTAGIDTITGGGGADTLWGGGGADTFVIGSSDSNLVWANSNTTISGYDVIKDFNPATNAINLPGSLTSSSVLGNTTTGDYNDSILKVGGSSGSIIGTHNVSNGIMAFKTTAGAALALSTVADVTAAVQYLQGQNIGQYKVVGFNATISGVNHTYIYEQLSSSAAPGTTSSRSLFVDLDNTNITNLTTLLGSKITPVALDLNGDGVSYLSVAAGIAHDYGADIGFLNTAWVGPHDGLLAYQQDSGSLNIVFSTQVGETDLQGLAKQYDTNHDGVLDAKDADFAKFGAWVDANSDGIQQAGEFQSLTALHIQSLSLTSDGNVQMGANGDVVVYGSTTYTTTDGAQHLAQDVGFATTPLDAISATDAPLDYAAIIAAAQSLQTTISIDQSGKLGSATALSVTLDGHNYQVGVMQGQEVDTRDALDAFLNTSDHGQTNAGAAWTEVVDISSSHGGPASVTAEGTGNLASAFHAKDGDWTVIVKSGSATVNEANNEIVFSTDHAQNSVTIVTSDGTSHDLHNIDKIQWHG